MKISPVAQGTGQPGQQLNQVTAGRVADPVKMERARAIARGEKVTEQPSDPQVERIQNVRKIKMRTNVSPDRLEDIPQPTPEAVPEAPAAAAPTPDAPLSSTPDANEQGAVEATQPLSPQFAALAKQKRALQLERAQLDKEKAELANRPKDGTELLTRLQSEPLKVLQEHGVLNPEFYNSLTQRLLDEQNGINPELLASVQGLEKKFNDLEKGFEQKLQARQEAQEEAALDDMFTEAEALAKEGEDFALIREQDAYEKVLRLIHSTYKQTGRVLDVRQAMEKVENELLSTAEKLARLGKVQSKITPPAPPPLQPQQRQMRTLTARDSSVAPMSARQRAIAAFNGTLKR